MKKTEVIWISREQHGPYEAWGEEPHKRKGWWTGRRYMGRISNIHMNSFLCLGIKIRKGRLARVTIERQY